MMKILFRDVWNPTSLEISEWAYSNEKIPDQDWELAVNNYENIPMICTFIEDEKCCHTAFFLSSLYVFTGDIVRSNDVKEIEKLSVLLSKLEMRAKSEKLKDWIKRSKYLLQHPKSYDYAYWGLSSKYVY